MQDCPSLHYICQNHGVHVTNMRGLDDQYNERLVFTSLRLTGVDVKYWCCNVIWLLVFAVRLCGHFPNPCWLLPA